MRARELVIAPFTMAYLALLAWCHSYAPEPIASDIAASSFTDMIRSGMRGYRTPYGPYRLMFTTAEFSLRWWGQANCVDIPFGIWRTIPYPMEDLVCQLSRAYALCHMGAEIAEVSKTEEDLLLSVLMRSRFDRNDSLVPPLGDPDVPVVMTILGRVDQVLAEHQCTHYDGCTEFGALWSHEEAVSERWRVDFQPRARNIINGYSQ